MRFPVLVLVMVLALVSPTWAARNFTVKAADGVTGFIPPTSDCVYDVALSANTARTVTWPASCGVNGYPAQYAIFSSSAAFWMSGNGQTAQIPSGDVVNGNGSMLNPAQVNYGGDVGISLISATDQVISISFYSSGGQ